jgi:hypothetical protein
MVQLPVKTGVLHSDWILLDLQGGLESDVSELKGLKMGDLSINENVTA